MARNLSDSVEEQSMYKNIVLAALVTSTALTLGGCASSLKGDVYSRDDARTPQIVRKGTIESLRPVQVEGTKTPIGAGAGAVVGGVAGSSIGGNGRRHDPHAGSRNHD
jgi:outer membrane lipoprotein SlyB